MAAQISPRVDLEFGEDLPTSRDSSELGWGGARAVPYQSDNSLMGTQDAARMSDGERHSLLLVSAMAARASAMHSPFKARLSRCDGKKSTITTAICGREMKACARSANQSYRNCFLRYSAEKPMIPIMSAGRAGHWDCERMGGKPIGTDNGFSLAVGM